MLNRRQLLCGSVSAMTASAAPQAVRFGLIADVHYGLMPDAERRLDAFAEACASRSLDFVMQMGDFCHPKPDARSFLKKWHGIHSSRYNVLGNHDMDFGTKRQIMDELEMPRNYYSFDRGGFHFAILDCNYILDGSRHVDFANGNYFGTGDRRDRVNTEQLEWLRADLAATPLPSLVFTHQCIDGYWNRPAPEPRAEVKALLTEANRASGWNKVFACFSGHEHVDHHSVAAGVHYLLVNSASYHWVGEEYGRFAKYTQPLYAFVTLSADGWLTMEGRRGEFIPPSPKQLGHPAGPFATASIEDRRIRIPHRPA
ncbi:MAG: metallophosphoesterase [Bryobacterales bacterium]|nr:metallophosphoesterase [Bryobacterales bacterium]